MTAPTISTEGLRELLERGAPVTVFDVRPAAERTEWSIPGSVPADAYDALRRGDPTALAEFRPRNGDRVVTVCAAGKTSLLAAERLRARGLHAVSLEGGMRAWSLAWNTAEVPCPGSTARIVQLRRTGKGCLSYLIGSNGAAVVIDASLDRQVYRRVAETHGWRIRTDLEASAEQARRRAHVLHASVQRLVALPPETVVLPAHTSEPVAFDGRPISATLREVQEGTSLLRETEEAFVSQILTRLPPTPPNHHRIVALNEAGTLPDDPTELEAGANRCAVA